MRKRRSLTLFLGILALPLLIAASRHRAVTRPPLPANLDMHRSFAVTDQFILDGFPFERVMKTLADRSGVPSATATRLYQQWFDTQNRKPGLDPAAPHCDDFLLDGKPAFNGFPRRCPTPEASQAGLQPFVPADYEPMALINRFDLAPADGSDCGQYRIIFAFTDKRIFLDRIHLIFEGVLPNPNRSAGLAGCRPVAQFWADLSAVNSMAERRARLENFFFNGIPGFAPVLHPDHYSAAIGGSVRTMQYTFDVLDHESPRFYQFTLEKRCGGDLRCNLWMEPALLENMPTARLFDARANSPTGMRFRQHFISQIETLAVRDLNGFFMKVPAEFLTVEGDALGDAFGFLSAFNSGLASPAGAQFRDAIQTELNRIGSPLSPAQIVARAETQNCTGCHFLAGPIGDGLQWPSAWPLFQHVGEEFRESGESGLRFAVSPAMKEVFLPRRMEILHQFLTTGRPPIHSNGDSPLSARAVH